MGDTIPGELWFAVARRDFHVWRILIKSVRVFWLYVQKNGGYKIVEKLFGNTFSYGLYIAEWKIGYRKYRFDGLPVLMSMLDGRIEWCKSKSKGLIGLYGDGFCLSGHYLHTLNYNGGFIRKDGDCSSMQGPLLAYYLGVSVYTDRISFAYSHSRTRHSLDMVWGLGDGQLLYFQPMRASDLPCILRYDGRFS